MTTSLLGFPDVVDERAARTVAGGVVLLASAAIVLRQPVLVGLLAYGFLARVAAGPRLSPLALLATRLIVPRLPGRPRMVPGPPKRFAQSIGAVLASTALVLLALGADTAAYGLLGAVVVAATSESALGFCVGCWLFALLMRVGVIPASVCERCAPVSVR